MNKFKKGDKVKVIDGNCNIPDGSIWEVKQSVYDYDDGDEFLALVGCKLTEDEAGWSASRFELAEIDITKPVLEERKKDKIRMELVDQGFPLALLELAKVMTWANENKGYKDHDWKNIPNAENAFKGAAARHRVKFDAQRSFGNEMLDCTDEESGVIHLAHEAFNVLALLELALVGKVK